MTRELVSVILLATALLGFALSRSVAPGVSVSRQTVVPSQGEPVPVLWVSPQDPKGTALLAHGITASKETLLCVAEALAANGFECCVLDLPGHGESSTPSSREAVDEAFAACASALRASRGQGQIDLLVGHSYGAGTGARACGRGLIKPRAFVAIGARPRLTGRRPERTLLIMGRLEELITAAELRSHAEAIGAEAIVVPWSDHALEPFDPQVASAIVRFAKPLLGESTGTESSSAVARLLGCALLFASSVLLAGLTLPRRPVGARAYAAGLLAAGSVLAPALLGLHGWWVYIAPTPIRAALALVAISVSFAVARGLNRMARREGRETDHGWAVYALVLSVAVVPVIALALAGRRFPALVVGLLFLLLLGGSGLGLLTRWRTESDLAGHVAFAVVVGYVPGVWFGGLL